MTAIPSRRRQQFLLEGAWLVNESGGASSEVPGMSVAADSRGFTLCGPEPGSERTIPWNQTTRFACQRPARLPDGSPATVLEVGLVNGRTLKLLLPVTKVPPSETLVVETELAAMSSRFREAPTQKPAESETPAAETARSAAGTAGARTAGRSSSAASSAGGQAAGKTMSTVGANRAATSQNGTAKATSNGVSAASRNGTGTQSRSAPTPAAKAPVESAPRATVPEVDPQPSVERMLPTLGQVAAAPPQPATFNPAPETGPAPSSPAPSSPAPSSPAASSPAASSPAASSPARSAPTPAPAPAPARAPAPAEPVTSRPMPPLAYEEADPDELLAPPLSAFFEPAPDAEAQPVQSPAVQAQVQPQVQQQPQQRPQAQPQQQPQVQPQQRPQAQSQPQPNAGFAPSMAGPAPAPYQRGPVEIQGSRPPQDYWRGGPDTVEERRWRSEQEAEERREERDRKMLRTLMILIGLVVCVLIAELILVLFVLNHHNSSQSEPIRSGTADAALVVQVQAKVTHTVLTPHTVAVAPKVSAPAVVRPVLVT
jgi:hypothetical protein